MLSSLGDTQAPGRMVGWGKQWLCCRPAAGKNRVAFSGSGLRQAAGEFSH